MSNAQQLDGRSVRRTRAWGNLRAFEAVHQPHTALAMHEHSAPFFTYVLRGEYLERTYAQLEGTGITLTARSRRASIAFRAR